MIVIHTRTCKDLYSSSVTPYSFYCIFKFTTIIVSVLTFWLAICVKILLLITKPCFRIISNYPVLITRKTLNNYCMFSVITRITIKVLG